MEKLNGKQVLYISIAGFLIPMLWMEYNVMIATNYTYSYPIDDTFIHLAIAKNIYLYQNWGVNPQQFVSASSSILYPLLLAGLFKIGGLSSVYPLLINIVTGILLILVVQRWLKRQRVSNLGQLIILLCLIVLVPFPVLAMSGMEHLLQLLFSFLFLTSFSHHLSIQHASNEKEWKFPWYVFLYGAILSGIRYESLMIIGMIFIILLFYKQYFVAFQFLVFCSLPIIVFGIISVYQGNYFAPNSVLLKSNVPELSPSGLFSFLTDGIFWRIFYPIVGYNTAATQRLLLIIPLILLMLIRFKMINTESKLLLCILFCASFIHLCTTGFAHFPRYEAYLIGLSTIILGSLFYKLLKSIFVGTNILQKGLIYCLFVLLITPLFLRSKTAFGEVQQACINIYQQQFQMGRFLHNYYFNGITACGDIGAISFLTAGYNIDIVGLANVEVAKSKIEKYYSPDFLDWFTKKENVSVAVVYDVFTYPSLVKRWQKIATWKIQNNVACGDDIVSFYAVEPSAAETLKKNLVTYQPVLPISVEVKYY